MSDPLDRIEAKIDRLEEKLEAKLDKLVSMVAEQRADFAAHVAADNEKFETIDERLAEVEEDVSVMTAQHVTDLRKQVDGDDAEKKLSKWWLLGIVGSIVAAIASPWFARSCAHAPTSHATVQAGGR